MQQPSPYTISVAQILQQLAPRKDVQLLAKRIYDLDANMRTLGLPACIVKAQICISIGAIPLPDQANEVHMYRKNPKDEESAIVIHVGNNYFMRMAEESGGFSFYRLRPATPDDVRFVRVGNGRPLDLLGGDIAYVGKIFNRREMAEILGTGQVTFSEFLDNFAVNCLGIVTQEEIESGKPPVGRDWSWMAEKRCRRDGFAKLFPIRPSKPLEVSFSPQVINKMLEDELEQPTPEMALFAQYSDADIDSDDPGLLDAVLEIINEPKPRQPATVNIDAINDSLFG